MALTWEDQKMNVITAGVLLVVGGMVAWHLFGGQGSAAHHRHAAATGFAAAPAASTSAVPSGPVPPRATPVAGTPGGSQTPAAITVGGSPGAAYAQTQNPASVTGTAPSGTVPVAALQSQLQPIESNITTLQQEVQELSTAMGKLDQRQILDERQTRVRLDAVARDSQPFAGKAWNTHSEVAGYRLQSIGETEAWLTDPDGQTVIARAGTRLPGLVILAIAPQGVKTNRGWLGF